MSAMIKFFICSFAWLLIQSVSEISSINAQQFIQNDFRVSDSSGYIYQNPNLSVSTSGDMLISWKTSGKGDILFRKVSDLGTILSDQEVVNKHSSTTNNKVAFADTGNFILMYRGYTSSWKVYAQVYDRNSNELGTNFVVDRNTDDMVTDFTSVFSNSDNQFVAFLPVYDSILVEVISGTGDFVGNTLVLKPDVSVPISLNGILTGSGNYLVSWLEASDGNIWAQRFTSEGAPNGDKFMAAQKEDNTSLSFLGISTDASDNFVVAYAKTTDSKQEIYTQLFNDQAAKVGTHQKVTDNISSYTGEAISVDMDEDGNFVLAWSDKRGTDTSFIYMQQMDENGLPVGGNFRGTTVNNNISANIPSQVEPCVKILRDTIYLSWMNFNLDLHNWQTVYANVQEWTIPIENNIHTVHSNTEFALYPNPSSGLVTLHADNVFSETPEIDVLNSTGKLVRKIIKDWTGTELNLNISDLPNGIYTINIRGESFIHSESLVIIK